MCLNTLKQCFVLINKTDPAKKLDLALELPLRCVMLLIKHDEQDKLLCTEASPPVSFLLLPLVPKRLDPLSRNTETFIRMTQRTELHRCLGICS